MSGAENNVSGFIWRCLFVTTIIAGLVFPIFQKRFLSLIFEEQLANNFKIVLEIKFTHVVQHKQNSKMNPLIKNFHVLWNFFYHSDMHCHLVFFFQSLGWISYMSSFKMNSLWWKCICIPKKNFRWRCGCWTHIHQQQTLSLNYAKRKQIKNLV